MSKTAGPSSVGKRAIRAGIRKMRTIAARLDPQDPGNAVNPAFIYASINATLTKLIAEDPRVLRPSYTWGVLQAAHLARTLGIKAVSVVEFGVAGGNGLVALERAAEKVEKLFGVHIDAHGFDTGRGLPKPTDYRDLPNLYRESDYQMDVEKLRSRLRRAQLHIGLVKDTLSKFIASQPAPIAFVSIDLDYYSSTADALTLLNVDHQLTLPRVHCYFDDIMGFTCSEFTGERLAIDEFNAGHARRKISPIFGLRYFLPSVYARQQWSEMFYLAHMFDHPLYGESDGLAIYSQRPLALR